MSHIVAIVNSEENTVFNLRGFVTAEEARAYKSGCYAAWETLHSSGEFDAYFIAEDREYLEADNRIVLQAIESAIAAAKKVCISLPGENSLTQQDLLVEGPITHVNTATASVATLEEAKAACLAHVRSCLKEGTSK